MTINPSFMSSKSNNTPPIAPKHWPGRTKVEKLLGVSRSSVKRREATGELICAHDEDGEMRFDPRQFDALREPKSNAVRTEPSVGERVAAAVALLRCGGSVADVVEQLKETFAFVQQVQGELCASENSFLVSTADRAGIEARVATAFGPNPVRNAATVILVLDALVHLPAQLRAVQAQVAALEVALSSAHQEVASSDQAHTDAAARAEQLKAQLELMENARDHHSERADAAITDLDEAHALIHELAAERDTATHRAEALEGELDDVRGQLAEVEARLAAALATAQRRPV